jgi:hypothetical protein
MEECACCCHERELTRCAHGHAVCDTCKTRLERSDCLFCVPHAPPALPRAARTAWRDAGCAILVTCVRFLGCVFAGKVYIWFYLVTQDQRCTWCAWDSLRHCMVEFLVGLVVTALLVGCCIQE